MPLSEKWIKAMLEWRALQVKSTKQIEAIFAEVAATNDRCAELEQAHIALNHATVWIEEMRAELEALKPDAERMRRIQKVRKDHVGIPCACEFADDEETVRTWCAAHAALRDRAQAENDRLRAEISLCRDEALLDDSEEITRLRAALVALEGKG